MRLFTEISSNQPTKSKKYLLNMEMKLNEDLYKYHNEKKRTKTQNIPRLRSFLPLLHFR